ncbi:hypothetical protein VYU27_003056 [Nannochloropsis oceanica]
MTAQTVSKPLPFDVAFTTTTTTATTTAKSRDPPSTAGAAAPAGPLSPLAASSTTHCQMKTNLTIALVVRVGPPTFSAAPENDLHLSSTASKPTAK